MKLKHTLKFFVIQFSLTNKKYISLMSLKNKVLINSLLHHLHYFIVKLFTFAF